MNKIESIDELVEHIYEDDFFRGYAASFTMDPVVQEEIFHEFLLKVVEKKERMLELQARGEFNYYAVAIIRNLVYNKHSPLNKHKIRDEESIRSNYYDDVHYESEYQEGSAEEDTRILLQKVKDIVDQSHWYDKEIFQMHFYKGMSYRGISKATTIPLSSIYNTVHNMQDKIRNVLGKEYSELPPLKR